MANGSAGTAGGAILGLVESAAQQLRDLIKKSSAQLRAFVDQSLAQLDERQKAAEAQIEAATRDAEARARAAADHGLAQMQALMERMERELAEHRADLASVRGLADKRLDIGDIGFDFAEDGTAVGLFGDTPESDPLARVARAPAPGEVRFSSDELKQIGRAFADVVRETGMVINTGVADSSGVSVITDQQFEEFVRSAVRGDVIATEVTGAFFHLVNAVYEVANGDSAAGLAHIEQIPEAQIDFETANEGLIAERIKKVRGS